MGYIVSEYSEEFDRLRKNRVIVSYHKYGPDRCKRFMTEPNQVAREVGELVDGDTKDGMFAIARFEACLQEAEGPYYTSRAERYGWEDGT